MPCRAEFRRVLQRGCGILCVVKLQRLLPVLIVFTLYTARKSFSSRCQKFSFTGSGGRVPNFGGFMGSVFQNITEVTSVFLSDTNDIVLPSPPEMSESISFIFFYLRAHAGYAAAQPVCPALVLFKAVTSAFTASFSPPRRCSSFAVLASANKLFKLRYAAANLMRRRSAPIHRLNSSPSPV